MPNDCKSVNTLLFFIAADYACTAPIEGLLNIFSFPKFFFA